MEMSAAQQEAEMAAGQEEMLSVPASTKPGPQCAPRADCIGGIVTLYWCRIFLSELV